MIGKLSLTIISYILAVDDTFTSTNLENRMHDFYEGNYDVLISTSIIESGLDLPNANTILANGLDNTIFYAILDKLNYAL